MRTEQDQSTLMISALKHDLNNALSGVQTALEVMGMDDAFCDSELREELNGVILASKKVRWLIEDLTMVSSPRIMDGESKQHCSVDQVFELLETFSNAQALEWTIDKGSVLSIPGSAEANARSFYYGLLARSLFQRQAGHFVFGVGEAGLEVTLSTVRQRAQASDRDVDMNKDERFLRYMDLSRLWISTFGARLRHEVTKAKAEFRWVLNA